MNAAERRLRWSTVPQPSQLRFITLKQNQSVKGDGDDLSIYFYQLDHEDGWICHNAIGEPVSGERLAPFVVDYQAEYFVCLTVRGMGDTNSADVAQRVHEEVLSEVHTPDTRIRYGDPLPDGSLMVGVCFDDLLVVHNTLTAAPHDEQPLKTAHEAYAQVGLETAPGKGFKGAQNFAARGALCEGRAGRLGMPLA